MKTKKLKTDMKKIYALYPVYDSRESFYNKALVCEDDGHILLYSYLTPCMVIDKTTHKYCFNPEVEIDLLFSNTTLRHIKEALRQFLSLQASKKQLEKNIYSKHDDKYDPSLVYLF